MDRPVKDAGELSSSSSSLSASSLLLSSLSLSSSLDSSLLQMFQLMQPEEIDCRVRLTIVEELTEILRHPGNAGSSNSSTGKGTGSHRLSAGLIACQGCNVVPFGSFESNLFTPWGDLDITLEIPKLDKLKKAELETKKRQILMSLQMLLWNAGLICNVQNVSHARVPLLKFVHRRTFISCDLSVSSNAGAAFKSRLIGWIANVDERGRQLMFLVKCWAQAQRINDSKNGSFNSFALVNMVVFHLQTLDLPILPPLAQFLASPQIQLSAAQGCAQRNRLLAECKERIDAFKRDSSRPRNTSSLSFLLMSFFKKYERFESRKKVVVSPFSGSWKEVQHCSPAWANKEYQIYVEDPFDYSENCARSVQAGQLQRVCDALSQSYREIFLCEHDSKEQVALLRERLFNWPENEPCPGFVTREQRVKVGPNTEVPINPPHILELPHSVRNSRGRSSSFSHSFPAAASAAACPASAAATIPTALSSVKSVGESPVVSRSNSSSSSSHLCTTFASPAANELVRTDANARHCKSPIVSREKGDGSCVETRVDCSRSGSSNCSVHVATDSGSTCSINRFAPLSFPPVPAVAEPVLSGYPHTAYPDPAHSSLPHSISDPSLTQPVYRYQSMSQFQSLDRSDTQPHQNSSFHFSQFQAKHGTSAFPSSLRVSYSACLSVATARPRPIHPTAERGQEGGIILGGDVSSLPSFPVPIVSSPPLCPQVSPSTQPHNQANWTREKKKSRQRIKAPQRTTGGSSQNANYRIVSQLKWIERKVQSEEKIPNKDGKREKLQAIGVSSDAAVSEQNGLISTRSKQKQRKKEKPEATAAMTAPPPSFSPVLPSSPPCCSSPPSLPFPFLPTVCSPFSASPFHTAFGVINTKENNDEKGEKKSQKEEKLAKDYARLTKILDQMNIHCRAEDHSEMTSTAHSEGTNSKHHRSSMNSMPGVWSCAKHSGGDTSNSRRSNGTESLSPGFSRMAEGRVGKSSVAAEGRRRRRERKGKRGTQWKQVSATTSEGRRESGEERERVFVPVGPYFRETGEMRDASEKRMVRGELEGEGTKKDIQEAIAADMKFDEKRRDGDDHDDGADARQPLFSKLETQLPNVPLLSDEEKVAAWLKARALRSESGLFRGKAPKPHKSKSTATKKSSGKSSVDRE